MIVKPFLQYLAEKFGTSDQPFRIYFAGGDYVYPRTTNAFAVSTARELGFEVVGEEYTDTSLRDYTPLIRRIESSNADLLIITNPGASGVTFMKQARLHGLTDKLVVSGFATFDQEAIEAMGDASEGVYCVNRYSNLLENAENSTFVDGFRSAYPDKTLFPGPTAAGGGYGALMVAAAAFEQAGSTEPEAFYQSMRSLEVDLPQGADQS